MSLFLKEQLENIKEFLNIKQEKKADVISPTIPDQDIVAEYNKTYDEELNNVVRENMKKFKNCIDRNMAKIQQNIPYDMEIGCYDLYSIPVCHDESKVENVKNEYKSGKYLEKIDGYKLIMVPPPPYMTMFYYSGKNEFYMQGDNNVRVRVSNTSVISTHWKFRESTLKVIPKEWEIPAYEGCQTH